MTDRRVSLGAGLPRIVNRLAWPRANTRRPQPPAWSGASIDAARWFTVCLVTVFAEQSERLFGSAAPAGSTLLLAPGCLLPFLVWWKARYWTAVFFGAVASRMLDLSLRGFDSPAWLAACVQSLGLAAELCCTSWLLERWGFRTAMNRGRDALCFLGAAVLGCAISGLIVMPIRLSSAPISALRWIETCGVAWLMHSTSLIVFAPALFTLRSSRRERTADWQLAIVFGAIVALASVLGFGIWQPVSRTPNPLIYLGLPMLVLAPLVAGSRGASAVTVLSCVAAAYATSVGKGPFRNADPLVAHLGLNIYLVALASTTYSVSTIADERRDALLRLRVGHSLLANAEKIAGVGSWQYDVRTGAEQWSDELYRLLKLMPGEIAPSIRLFQQRFVAPEDRERFVGSWESFQRTGQPNSVEYRVIRADESERIFRGQGEIQRDHDGAPIRFVGTLRDVTELRRAEALKERMQALLSKAEEIANLGSWEIDGSGDMRMWSDNMYRICGLRREEFDGRFETFIERLVHPDDREQLVRQFRDFAQGRDATDSSDFRILRGDGQVRDLHVQVQVFHRQNGQLAGCFGTTTDVTERKQAERRLKESEQRYRLLAEHASDMIARIGADLEITYVSPACFKILGYEPEEMLGRPFSDFISVEDRGYCRDMVDGLFAGDDRPSIPFRGLRKDGSVVWLESKAKPIVEESGRQELLCLTRDITQRRRLEEQVAEAQRLEAVGRLAGGVAHDFNNILTVINGYAEILETRFPPDDPASKYVENILEAGSRAAHLTRQLLTYSRKQIVTRGLVDFNEILNKLELLIRPLMGEGVETVCRLDPRIGLVEGDLRQLEQLVMNLAINARDAMPEGGRLTFQTENVLFAPGEPRPGRLAAGRYVKLTVSDTGIGMDDAVRARLFEPFFTTKGEGQGTGLGLATVYATMEQMGGVILVDSAPEAGARFDLYFPCREHSVAAAAASQPASASVAAAAPNRRILLVEDNPSVRSLVELTLKQAGYHVVAVSGGEEALGIVAAQPPFDLLLADVVMNGMNGRELADRIRRHRPGLPVIFMSGHTEDSVVRCGVLNHEVVLLYKPFTAAELTARIQEVFAEPAP